MKILPVGVLCRLSLQIVRDQPEETQQIATRVVPAFARALLRCVRKVKILTLS